MIRIFRTNRDEVITNLIRWADALTTDPSVLCVVLFGSYARGDCTAASDADILVLLKESPVAFHHRSSLYRPERLGVSADVFVYTPGEARKSLEEGWGVVGPALREGLMLAGKESLQDYLI
ncbi:MAG: nucleotidyltransferase domain-containing protein [Armatimonadetes bacterium]|nr:nucleotidyltransferase domain-containing protein [Armatimonadota bacterium]